MKFHPFTIVLILALILAVSSPVPSMTVSSLAGDGYVYYGYMPSRIWRNETLPGQERAPFIWAVNPGNVRTTGLLLLLGNQDGTRAWVQVLPSGEEVGSFTLRRLQQAVISLPNGTCFKVSADRPVTVMLLGGASIDGESLSWTRGEAEIVAAGISTFHTSIDGGYVGREFVFYSVQLEAPHTYAGTLPHAVIALEDSHVEVWDENGSRVASFDVAANKMKHFSLTTTKVYRLTSTGNVMLQTFATGDERARSCFLPSPQGGFVGRILYTFGHPAARAYAAYPEGRGYVATSLDGSKVEVVDLDYGKKTGDLTVGKGLNLSFQLAPFHVGLACEKPTLIMYMSSYNEGGLAVAGLKAGQVVKLLVPPGEAYVFACKDTVVRLDDMELRLAADSNLRLWEGLHELSATENLLLEIVNVGEGQGLGSFGACLPSAQSLGMTYDGLKLKPLIPEELPWMPIAGAAAVAVVAVLAWRLRKR